MINESNYFTGTSARFAALPLTWAKRLFSLREADGVVRLGNKNFRKNFVSGSSFYWVSTDGQYLVRLSDHWSEGSSVTNCGWIATCRWSLENSRGALKTGKTFNRFARTYVPEGFEAGIVAFRDMRLLAKRPLSKFERIKFESEVM